MGIETFLPLVFFIESLFAGPVYKHGVVGFPNSLNPLFAKNDSEKIVDSLVYRGLFKYDENKNIIPDLAESYIVGKDKLSYEVKLKSGIYWHNGKEITANDVLYTASKSTVLREISTDKIDDRTVRFNLPNEFSPFLDILTLKIVPSESQNDNRSFGSGDYKIARIKRDKSLIREVVLFTNSPQYKFKKIVFRFYENEESLAKAYQAGEINGFVSKERFVWDKISDFRVPFYGRYYVLIFNTKSKIFSEAPERKKFAESLDYDFLFDSILKEKGVKAYGPLSHTFAELSDLDYQKTEKMVKDGNLIADKIKLYFMFGDINKEVAEYMKDVWEDAGFAVDITELPKENPTEVLQKAEFDAALIAQEVFVDPDRYVFWHSTQSAPNGLNFGSYKALRVDKALEEGRKALDREERKKHYANIQKSFLDDVPAIFLYHPVFHFYINSAIEGINLKDVFYPWDIFNSLEHWTLSK